MRLLLVCEGEGDPEDLVALTLRVLHEAFPWMRGLESLQEPTPVWWAFEPGRGFLKWSDIDKLCEQRRVPPVHGPGMHLGRRAATRLTRLLSRPGERPSDMPLRVLWVHDDDHVPGWWASLDAARTDWLSWLDQQHRANASVRVDVDIAVGVATPEHEAWVLAGFVPQDDTERATLEAARAHLGFDPCTQGEQLTSGRERDARDAKRVLRALGLTAERRRTLLAETDLDVLRGRGQRNGLAAFLDEIQTRLARA